MPRSRQYRRADGLPATLRRSCRETQDAFSRAYDQAVQADGEGDQAYRAGRGQTEWPRTGHGPGWYAGRWLARAVLGVPQDGADHLGGLPHRIE